MMMRTLFSHLLLPVIPGLQESIISKYWTKFNSFKTSIDDDENIILTSTTFSFKAVSDYNNKITVFPTIPALESWFGNKPFIKHLCQFDCIEYHRLPDEIITKGQKISIRSIKCCIVGYIGNQIYRF